MDITKQLRLLSASVLVLACIISPRARAETTLCTNITSLPTTISTQGVYCLHQHLTTSLATGSAITVSVNNVTIDCNDFKVGNLAAGPTTDAVGIIATSRLNVTVRNCGIRGFRSGVQMTNGDYRVESNRLDQNTQSGIVVSGDGSSITGNEIISTGNSTAAGVTSFHGIQASGDIDIIDNNVTDVSATAGSNGTAYGIRTDSMDAGAIRGNRIRNLASDGSGSRRGIWNADGNRNTVEGNTIVMSGSLIVGDVGIRCGDGLILSGASRNNTILGTGVLGTALGLVNCTSVAGDYVNPL